LPSIQREIDALKFKVDELCDSDIPQMGAASPDRKGVYEKCNELTAAVYDITNRLSKLSVKNEKLPTAEFESKKTQEIRRLTMLKEKLDQIAAQLEPDEMEEDYLSKFMDGRAPSVSDVNSVDGREIANENGDDSQEELEVYRVEALGDFAGDVDGDLPFKKGDILTVIETRDDGWWVGEDKNKKTGLVPSTLLKILEEDEEEDEEEGEPAEEMKMPKKIISEKPPLQKKRSGKDLWQSLRMSRAEPTVTDVLKAMNAVPSGFRSSTLSVLHKEEIHKTSFWLTPKLSSSNLAFRDAFWDPVNKKLRPRTVKLTRTFSLITAKFIPPPGAGLETKSRHVRIAFWDGKNIYGNVHVVRAVSLDRDEQTWNFTPKTSAFLPSLYDGECIARINSSTANLALLFELSYAYLRTTTGDKGELSAGWCSLPLFELDGTPIVNKTYELPLRGGTPYEKGVEVDASIGFKSSPSLFQSLIRTNKQPRLVVKMVALNRVQKMQYDLMPDLLITCDRHVKFIVYYRELFARTFLSEDDTRGDFVCDVVLANFAKAFDYPDLVDALQMTWDDKSKANLSRSLRRDSEHMMKFFKQCFIQSTYSVMQCANLPAYIWANEEAEQERVKFITSYLAEKNSSANLFSPNSVFRPFDIRKSAFDVLSRKCLLASDNG